MTIKRTLLPAFAAALLLSTAAVAQAGSLENLERERAIVLETLLTPGLSAPEREHKIATSKHRLVDLERMVLRDDSLKGKNTPVIRKAFANYDLNFLVHASVEKKTPLIDHWLEQVGISTHTLMNARVGRR